MGFFRKFKTIDEMLPGFWLKKQTEICPKAAMTYNSMCLVFADWLETKGKRNLPMIKISQDDMTEFFYYLGRDKNLDRPTCEKYCMNIKAFWKYAEEYGEINELPFDHITFPRKKKDQGAAVIRPEHLKVLLPLIEKEDPQLYLACMIQYYCFIRPGNELRLIKVGDIDVNTGLIAVRQENAKNGIKQVVTMPQQLIDICHEYKIDLADKSLFVFGKRKRFNTKAISVNMLRWRFNQFRDRLNLPKEYKFYSFKHTGASMLHQSGISMRELMDQLRHTKLDATQHYLKKHCGIVNNRIRDNFPSPI